MSPPRITAVCAENIAAATSSTNTVLALVSGKVAKGFTVFVEHLNPGFVYTSQPSPSGGPSHLQLFFHLSFYARSTASERAGPAYISLCWLPEDQAWALGGFITDRCLGIRTIF